MSTHRLFKYVSEPAKFVLGTETQVYVQTIEHIALGLVETKIIDVKRAVPVYLESSQLNWMATLSSSEMGGVHRIQGYDIAYDGSIKPCGLGTGTYGAVMLDDLAYFRKEGVLLVGKAKLQTDVFYKWIAPHKDTIPLWQLFLHNGKLFKEFQRCLGGTIVEPADNPVRQWNAVVFDMDDYMKSVHNIDMVEAGDGITITKHMLSLVYGGAVEEMYSFGLRVLDHDIFKSVKGNMVSDENLHAKICKHYGLYANAIDILIPRIAIKVGSPELLKSYDITDNIRFISYRTERVQAYGRITCVGASTLGKYATVVCSLLDKFSSVDAITNLCTEVIEGDLGAYAKAVKAGMNSSVMAEVSAIALPIWKDEKWTIIRTKEHLDQLYSRVTSLHQKHVRKAKLKRAVNRRAYWTPSIEAANVDNHTGAYIVRLRKGVIEIPQYVWVGKTLGDYDGDDAVIVQVARGVYLIFRNPVNGPSSMFVGLEKGKAKVQDVPEWLMPLVKYHKVSKAVPEPPKGKVVLADTLKGLVTQYIETLVNAWANAPLLGQATNNLYLGRLVQICTGVNLKAQEYANDAAKIEFEVVKAIKSTLTADIKLSTFAGSVDFGVVITDDHCHKLQLVGTIIEQINRMKLEAIFPRPKLDHVSETAWDVCSKFNYQSSYENYMKNIIKSTRSLLDGDDACSRKLDTVLPIVRACSGYNPQVWIKQDDTDVLIANAICREICGNKRYYKLPAVVMDEVRKVNIMYMIFTSKRTPSDEFIDKVQSYLQTCIDHIRKYNIKADALVKEKMNVAKVLLRRFMGVGDKCSLDNIITGFTNGADILMGVRDIYDTQLRSFAYTCIHAYIKGYITTQFVDENARCSAMFETGRIVFGVNNGIAKSSRLFWQYFSTFSKENMAKISNMWMDAQQRTNLNVVDDCPLDVDMMADLFEHAHNVTYDDVSNCNPLDVGAFIYDGIDYDDFDGFDDTIVDCLMVDDDDPNDFLE